MIDIYSKWGEIQCRFCGFDEMVAGDLAAWNSIIVEFGQNGNGDEALENFIDMKRAGFSGHHASLTSVMRVCTGLALLKLERQVHVYVVKSPKDLILDNALLDMLCHTVQDVKPHYQILKPTLTIRTFSHDGYGSHKRTGCCLVVANSLKYCDVVTTTTHKSFRGPRGGMIFFKKDPVLGVDMESAINNVVFP
ncbi:hypothetical protein GIB67_002418, partial [Kingdonia uniflora]